MPLFADDAERCETGFTTIKHHAQRSIAGALAPANKVITKNLEGGAFDWMKAARRKHQCGTRTVNFLANLPRTLAVGIQILKRELETTIDMTVTVFRRQDFCRQRIGVIMPGPIQRIFAIFRDQHSNRRIEVGTALVEIDFKRSEGIKALIYRHVGRVLQAGGAQKIPIMNCMFEFTLPDFSVVEEAREIDITLLSVDHVVSDTVQPHARRRAPRGEVGLIIEIEAHAHRRINRRFRFIKKSRLSG
jgi:hypothetical protein